MSSTDISVVIPVFNGERFLGQAIESVLAQDRQALEIVVVDDGSTDASAAIAQSFGEVVRCVRTENRGAGAARNSGVAISRGRLLAFLDADDIWLADKLRLQLERLNAEPGLECVFGLVDHVYEDGESAGLQVRVQPAAPGLVPGTMLIRRQAFRRVGPFSEKERIGEFVEWYGRARTCGLRFATIQHVVLQRRIHSGNTSRRLAASRGDYLQILRANLQRRREIARQASPLRTRESG